MLSESLTTIMLSNLEISKEDNILGDVVSPFLVYIIQFGIAGRARRPPYRDPVTRGGRQRLTGCGAFKPNFPPSARRKFGRRLLRQQTKGRPSTRSAAAKEAEALAAVLEEANSVEAAEAAAEAEDPAATVDAPIRGRPTDGEHRQRPEPLQPPRHHRLWQSVHFST